MIRKAKRIGTAAVKYARSHRRKESLEEKLLLVWDDLWSLHTTDTTQTNTDLHFMFDFYVISSMGDRFKMLVTGYIMEAHYNKIGNIHLGDLLIWIIIGGYIIGNEHSLQSIWYKICSIGTL